jgi:hypothetical protein
VPCVFIKADESDAKLIAVAENIWRKQFTVLRQAELLVEYCRLALTPKNVSGQVDQKNGRGRPRGGAAEAARKLPPLSSWESRRKKLDRAYKIAGLVPKVKQAAIDARLDNNQRALLAIAKVASVKKQLKLIAELALNDPLKRYKRSNSEGNPSPDEKLEGPPLQPSSSSAGGKDFATEPQTTWEVLKAHWGDKGKRLWRLTSLLDP